MSELLGEKLTEEIRAIARNVFQELIGEHANEPTDVEAVDAKEAAVLLGVSQWRVYEMIKQNLIPAYRPSPKRLLILRSAIREFQRGKAA